jgi:hypothetical protein
MDPLVREPGQDGFFGLCSAWQDDLALAGVLILESHSLGRPEATGTPNSQKHSKPVLWLAGFCPIGQTDCLLPPLFQLLWSSIGSHALYYIRVEEIFPLLMQSSVIAEFSDPRRESHIQIVSEGVFFSIDSG